MPSAWSPQGALLDEFGCYWLGDEIPDVRAVSLTREADRAAGRLVRIHGNRAAEVAALLREMAADRSHPLFEPIAEGTLIAGLENLDGFHRVLLRLMADPGRGIQLEPCRPPGPSVPGNTPPVG